jgi:serine/threonine protein phosphatase PrpC
MGPDLKISVNSKSIDEFDRTLLMSDGVTDVFHPLDAAGLTIEHVDIAQAVNALVQRSQTLGSSDDITAMLVEIEEIWE